MMTRHVLLVTVVSMVLYQDILAQDTAQLSLQDLDKDLERLMEDEQLFNEYYKCLVDTGPCNKDTRNFKDMVSEAMRRGFARCSPSQRQEAVELLRMVMECRPREYAEIERHFDPTGSFRGKYQASALARGLRPTHIRDSHLRREDVQEDEESCTSASRWGGGATRNQ